MIQLQPIISGMLKNKSGPILILFQAIISIVIVANAGYIIKQWLDLMARDSGVEESELLYFDIFNFDHNIDGLVQSQRDLEILRSLPGVVDAVVSNMVPLSGSGWTSNFSFGDSEKSKENSENSATYFGDEQFIPTLGLNIIEGRNFRQDEILEGSNEIPTMGIISAQFAKSIWGDESAIGKTLFQQGFGNDPLKIIGVVERLQGAWVNSSFVDNSIILNVRTDLSFPKFIARIDPSSADRLKEVIPEALHKDNQNRVINGFQLITERRKKAYKSHELMATALFLMVIFLLLITSLGLAGMVMFNIEKRTKQIGTRRALGARKIDIVIYFLTENYLISFISGAAGIFLALEFGKYLMTLYDLPLLEVKYAIATYILFLLVTTIAVMIPTRSAVRISPSIATRSI